MMLAGLAIGIAAVLPISAQGTAIVLIAATVASTMVPVASSWWLWHRVRPA